MIDTWFISYWLDVVRFALVVIECDLLQAQSLDAGHMSDTTASPPASDDEASSMLHPSPAEHGAGFESGASAIDSASGYWLYYSRASVRVKVRTSVIQS
jgi:hypothetical protein